MIAKERDPSEHSDVNKFTIAGAKAEKQMAFYLKGQETLLHPV